MSLTSCLEIPAKSIVFAQPAENQPECVKNIKNSFLPSSPKDFSDVFSFFSIYVLQNFQNVLNFQSKLDFENRNVPLVAS